MSDDKTLKIYSTTSLPCPYLPDRLSRNGVVDCSNHDPKETYDYLIRKGFRRNSHVIYRPFCEPCTQCISTRILTSQFTLSRSQKRSFKSNQDLEVIVNRSGFKQSYQTLYETYIASRHEETNADGAEEFFQTDWCNTLYAEFYSNAVLIGVAVIDEVEDGLSAVYTFFDPDEGSKRGIGTYAILWQINYAKQLEKPYVYLGYWIEKCQKMSYKNKFQPLEGYIQGEWIRIPKFTLQGAARG